MDSRIIARLFSRVVSSTAVTWWSHDLPTMQTARVPVSMSVCTPGVVLNVRRFMSGATEGRNCKALPIDLLCQTEEFLGPSDSTRGNRLPGIARPIHPAGGQS